MQPFDPSSPRVLIALGGFAVCYLFAAAFFVLSRNARLKRTLLPYVGVLLGGLFLAWWPLTAGFPLQAFYSFVPLAAVMVFLNVRALQFCQACGATVRGGALSSRPKFCPKCGAGLGGAPK
jgi:hypothetical protein